MIPLGSKWVSKEESNFKYLYEIVEKVILDTDVVYYRFFSEREVWLEDTIRDNFIFVKSSETVQANSTDWTKSYELTEG